MLDRFLEGKKTVKYLGLVSGHAILGANIFRDFFASVRDIVGGRSGGYEAELRKAKDIALGEMQEQAEHCRHRSRLRNDRYEQHHVDGQCERHGSRGGVAGG